MRRAGDVLAWVAAVVTWGLVALVPVAVFLGLVAAGATALWWAAGFG